MSRTKSRQKIIYRRSVENLSTAKGWSRWIEDLSRFYRADRENKNFTQWIGEIVKKLSRDNPKISIDRESVETWRRKLNIKESVEVSRSCRAWRKKVFQEGRNTERWMQQTSYSNKHPRHILSSQISSQTRCKTFIDPNTNTHTHTHTHNKSNQFYI